MTTTPEPRTIDELLRMRASASPDLPIAAFPTSKEPDSYEEHTAGQLDDYATRGAHHYQAFFGNRERNSPEQAIALLAVSDLDYVATVFALGRLGFTVLCLSTRLSPEAICNLLEKTNCGSMVFEPDHQATVDKITAQRPLHTAPIFKNYRSGPLIEIEIDLDPDFETNTSCNILHSSGSTGFPKPIRNIHKSYVYNASINLGLRGFITLPLFHNHGMCSFLRALYAGKTIYFYNPHLPLSARLITAVFKHLGDKLEVFYGVPYALKLLANKEGIEMLKRLKVVMFGGSACPDDLGNLFVDAGVNLVAHYGATEVGQLMTSQREPGDKEWNWLRPSPAVLPFMRWTQHGEGYELVITDGWKAKVVSNQEDNSYATRDLFVRHPEKNDRFKYMGRLDDWIILVNGEKLNPVQFEHTVLADDHVAEAVVFGVGQVSAGLIIVPVQGFDSLSEDEFLKLVQPAIDAANALAEAHAKIDREHIRVLTSDAADGCPKTDKGTVIRTAFYKKFEALITAVYQDAEHRGGGDLQLNLEETQAWLKELTAEILKLEPTAELSNRTDFFQLGLDSLGAYRMFARILHTLDLGPNASELPSNACFEYPNIHSLASYLFALRTGADHCKRSEIEEMQVLIDRYATFDEQTVADAGPPRVVLLTGATGSLGAHILGALLKLPNIEKIYCLNRGTEAHARTLESLATRGLNVPSDRIQSFSTDLTQPDFGLDPGILAGVNLVIHNAWSVNFNMGVSSFENHIQGTRNLINFSFESDARFFFVSSVSAAVRSGSSVPESHLNHLTDAQQMGYARSKLVAERLCSQAHHAGLDARVLRVGQIVGDTQHGQWNETEGIPLMIRSAVSMGALPTLNDTLNWLPIDIVAQVVTELCHSAEQRDVYHLVNPKSFNWSNDLLPMLQDAGLPFEKVSQQEWLKRLEASNPDPTINPTIKLLEFFKTKYATPKSGPSIKFETSATESVSQTLRTVSAPDAALIRKMVAYWTTECWTNPTDASS